MTHKDIYTKFMIEYDKANVTSSYPSLTEYEAATILNKAYHALIAQKLTGNNPRQVSFEQDVKSIQDLQPLVDRQSLSLSASTHAPNVVEATLPTQYMYFVQLMLRQGSVSAASSTTPTEQPSNPNSGTAGQMPISDQIQDQVGHGDDTVYTGDPQQYDGWDNPTHHTDVTEGGTQSDITYVVPVKLTSHDVAEKFMVTPYNKPWVKIPVAYMEGNKVEIVYDPVNKPNVTSGSSAYLTYIKKFAEFTSASLEAAASSQNEVQFELSDSMAEELINLAIVLTLENVESTRLNSKINLRGLEA